LIFGGVLSSNGCPEDDRVWSFREAEEPHAMLPGSRLMPPPSNNHMLQADEPAFARFIEGVGELVAI